MTPVEITVRGSHTATLPPEQATVFANLGAEGCCIRVPASAASTFKNRMLLEGMELIHPDLPKEAIKGRVVWLRTEKGAGKDSKDFVETGIQFTGASKNYGAQVDRYVTALLKSEPKTSM